MLVIRLARAGRAKYPTYRIVAAESARAATGRFIEVLGHYNPHTKELVIKREETLARLAHGAQPSNTVVKLLTRENLELPSWVKLKTKAAKVVASEPTEAEVSAAENSEVEPESAPAAEEVAAPIEDEVRVAGVAEDVASDAEGDAPNINHTDTAADDDAAVEDAEAAHTAGADAASETDQK